MSSNTLKTLIIGLVCIAIAYGIGRNMDNFKKGSDAPEYFGKTEVTVENGVLDAKAMIKMGRLSDPQLSPDGSRILYGVSYTNINLNRSCRNIFVCNIDGSDNIQLTYEGQSINNARWSKDGKIVLFLMEGQIYKAAFKGDCLGRKYQVSSVPEGISEFKLSPDGEKVMYISTIPGPVKNPSSTYGDLGKAKAYVAEDLMYRHWDHWVTETPRTYIADLNQKKITRSTSTDILGNEPYELPTEPFGGLEQLSWSPDGKTIAYSCRKKTGIEYAFSTNTDIFLYDVESGKTCNITSGGGYDTDPVWSPDGQHLAWISMERDGYEADRQRVMICNPDGSNVRELTSGFIYDAAGICWSPESDEIIFPTTINAVGALCAVDAVSEKPAVRRLTPEDWLYSYTTPFDVRKENGAYTILSSYNCMTFPSELVSINVPAEGEAVLKQITEENKDILDSLAEITQEQICIKTPEGEDLYCWVLYPADFDPAIKYPIVEMFNGGPQTSLDQSWSYRWNFCLMAHQGYVVLLPNRHGDSGFGQAWKEQISGDYQGLNMEDYMLAAKWAKQQPWCGKIAGVGASYGGFSVYNMMGLHGDLYDCFIAHAGIFNEKQLWYSTEEAWFGNWDNGGLEEYAYEAGKTGPAGDGITFGGMQQAGAPYADVARTKHHYANDPEAKITKWHTPILCIHGMMDYRIPYEQALAAFNAARMMGVPAKLIVFPEENHWVLQPQNALFWHREFYDWLDKYTRQ